MELANPRADIYAFPLRHYILGLHDERAYYWPEHHVRLFRRGAVTFSRTVHAGLVRHSERVATLAPDEGICIHHLSHPDVSGWTEKTNRYTSRPDRAGMIAGPEGFAAFAHQRIDHWMARTRDGSPDGYAAAVALLRAVYDMIDAVKTWEASVGLDGSVLFQQTCAELDEAYDSRRNLMPTARPVRRWTIRMDRHMTPPVSGTERAAEVHGRNTGDDNRAGLDTASATGIRHRRLAGTWR